MNGATGTGTRRNQILFEPVGGRSDVRKPIDPYTA